MADNQDNNWKDTLNKADRKLSDTLQHSALGDNFRKTSAELTNIKDSVPVKKTMEAGSNILRDIRKAIPSQSTENPFQVWNAVLDD